jgi:hypothetical protein
MLYGYRFKESVLYTVAIYQSIFFVVVYVSMIFNSTTDEKYWMDLSDPWVARVGPFTIFIMGCIPASGS